MTRAPLLAAAAAAATLVCGPAPAQPPGGSRGEAPPPGDYFQTCRNISTFGRGLDATMVAECRDRNGGWRQTSIRYAGCDRIDNRDGALACLPSRDYAGPIPPRGPDLPPPGFDRDRDHDFDRDDDRRRGRPAITLFSEPGFGGQPFFTDRGFTNLPREYNDRAMSLRIEGRRAWMVCGDKNFGGHCEVFDRDVPDLRRYGLGGQISSLQPLR